LRDGDHPAEIHLPPPVRSPAGPSLKIHRHLTECERKTEAIILWSFGRLLDSGPEIYVRGPAETGGSPCTPGSAQERRSQSCNPPEVTAFYRNCIPPLLALCPSLAGVPNSELCTAHLPMSRGPELQTAKVTAIPGSIALTSGTRCYEIEAAMLERGP
jgi:hypothetical protein